MTSPRLRPALIAVALVLIAFGFLAPKLIAPLDIQENRMLAEAPSWPKRLGDLPAFKAGLEAYVADRFPARTHLIGLLNLLRLQAGVTGSNRVVVGRQGWLFFDDDSHLGAARGEPRLTDIEARGWLLGLAGRTQALKARGIPYLVVAMPTKETVYPQFGPSWYKGPNPDRKAFELARLAHASGAGEVLHLYPALAKATAAGAQTYSRHDTHWTGPGAYAGYAAIMERLQQMGLGEPARPVSAFQPHRPRGFSMPRDLALMLGVASFVDVDYLELRDPAVEARAKITYLSPQHDWTRLHIIDTGQSGKPVLLMTVDSFSNELLPFLYPHFSRLVVVHNGEGVWREDLIDRFKPDLVVFEVIETGLAFGMDPAPAASPDAAARIEPAISALPLSEGWTRTFGLRRVDMSAAAFAPLAGAKPARRCTVDEADFLPRSQTWPRLVLRGWIWQPGRSPTPDRAMGAVRLTGPGGDYLAAIPVDGDRPDVAAALSTPRAVASGFKEDLRADAVAPGRYGVTAYRRTIRGWVSCPGRQTVVVP